MVSGWDLVVCGKIAAVQSGFWNPESGMMKLTNCIGRCHSKRKRVSKQIRPTKGSPKSNLSILFEKMRHNKLILVSKRLDVLLKSVHL